MASLYCIACGAANAPQATYCFACGESMQATHRASTGELAFDSLIQQRYRVLARLGKGGFGAVYKVADTNLGDRILALKEMSQSGLNAQDVTEAAAAFKREALMLAGLAHPSLPRIYDHFSANGRWYLVMDFIEGETLEDYLHKAGGRLPLEKVLDIAVSLCAVLAYLHSRQPPIIFRDLKPGNIMLTPGGNISLIDFGIARHFKPGQAKDTIAFGSPGYAAPEQYGKAQTTARADIYSLGATLHQLLTGNDPTDTPFSFVSLHSGIPELDQLILQMVNVDTNKRPASTAEVKQELQRISDQLHTGQTTGAQTAVYAYTQGGNAVHVSKGAGPISLMGTLLSKYSSHLGRIRCVAWSPGGALIASASDDKTVHVWEAATGNPLLIYRGHSDWVNAVAWSPDGKYIVSASSDKTAQVWNASSGSHIFTYKGHSGWLGGGVNAAAWSPDSLHIATASHDKTVHIWNATSGLKTLVYRGHSGGIWTASWSPDSRYIASGGYAISPADAALHIWDTTTRQTLLTYPEHSRGVLAVAWSPAGGGDRIVSAGSDMKVQVWNASTGSALCTYHGHSATVWSVAWSPDGKRVASGSADATVQIWDAWTGVTAFKYLGHSGTAWGVVPEVRTVAWSPDGQYIASGGSDNSVVQVWQAS